MSEPADTKTPKGVIDKIRSVFVQEDNPNSPHKLFARMNQNMIGDAGSGFDQREDAPAPEVTENDKKRKKKLNPMDNFDRLVWGDED